jgi:6-phosphofructokinase 2
MILTVTLNPVLDKSVEVEQIVAEQKLRCTNPVCYAGGGGINVSKGIQKLGGRSLALFPSGGSNGQKIEQLLREAEVELLTIPVSYENREGFSVRSTHTNEQFRFNMPGEQISAATLEEIFQKIKQTKPAIIVASGSLPPGAPVDTYAQLARIARSISAKMTLDTSDEPLKQAAESGVYLLKPNITELCKLVGVENLELDLVDEAAQEIIAKGYCVVAVVSLGPNGALLVTKDSYQHYPAPLVKKLSTVGAGDSMVAGMAFALSKGKSLHEMVQLGVACGSAATMNPGSTLFKTTDVERLLKYMKQA